MHCVNLRSHLVVYTTLLPLHRPASTAQHAQQASRGWATQLETSGVALGGLCLIHRRSEWQQWAGRDAQLPSHPHA